MEISKAIEAQGSTHSLRPHSLASTTATTTTTKGLNMETAKAETRPNINVTHGDSEEILNSVTASGDDAEHAAQTMQRYWRARRKQTHPTNTEGKWNELDVQLKHQIAQSAAEEGKNDARSRWRRAVFLASQLQDGEAISEARALSQQEQDLSSSSRAAAEAPAPSLPAKDQIKTKILETQHWLELIDGKHRYGSNLKVLSQPDSASVLIHDTNTVLFSYMAERRYIRQFLSLAGSRRWKGIGSTRVLTKPTREYLSPEQRMNYLVKIDPQGRLRWARNDQLVDTYPNKWKDSEGGMGIIPLDGTEDHAVEHRMRRQVSTLSGGPAASSSSMGSEGEAMHYVGDPNESKFIRALRSRFTAGGITNRLLRKTVKKNTWIYAADTKFNMFVGIKSTGSFQHSSLTGGGSITSAGLIKVKEGQIRSLSPLSGHYRTSIEHFKGFLQALESRGADLRSVHQSKAEAVLWGLEKYTKFKKSQTEFIHRRKDSLNRALSHLPHLQKHRDGAGEHSSPPKEKQREQRDPDYELDDSKAVDDEPETEEETRWKQENPSWRHDILSGRSQRVGSTLKHAGMVAGNYAKELVAVPGAAHADDKQENMGERSNDIAR